MTEGSKTSRSKPTLRKVTEAEGWQWDHDVCGRCSEERAITTSPSVWGRAQGGTDVSENCTWTSVTTQSR